MTRRFKIAIVSLTLPGFPGKSGGEIRDWNILKHITGKHNVDFYCLYPPVNIEDNLVVSQCRQFYYPQKNAEQYPELIYNACFTKLEQFQSKFIKNILAKYPPEIHGFQTVFYTYTKNILQKRLYEEDYDFIIVTPQVNPVFVSGLEIPHRCKRIFATYDVEKVRYHQLAKTKKTFLEKLLFKIETHKACKYEYDVVKQVDGIIAVSELDRELFIRDYQVAQERVLCIENGVDTEYISSFVSNDIPGRGHNLVYVGNMGYPPNKQAVEYFINQIFPRVLENIPDSCFWIVGANVGDDLKRLHNGKTIVVTGEVLDVREYWNMADVVCVPLLTGSGTKLKILEALASEKVIVTTSIGAEGLAMKDGEHLLIRDDPQQFAQAVITCLNNKDYAQSLAQTGRKFAADRHDWVAIVPKVDSWLEKLYELPRSK
ncbi:MAG: putative glycosyltransferase [Neobacillus sp.]|jgi:glycosyltransferase involved in cell wall biosynthesis|nr:putative glycosyltransferase [Neobacillus sp.]